MQYPGEYDVSLLTLIGAAIGLFAGLFMLGAILAILDWLQNKYDAWRDKNKP